jgi:type IV pilus assembly protein PilO
MASPKLKTGGASLANLSTVGKLLIGVVFVAVVGAAYFVVFFGETASQIETTKGELTDQQAKLSDAESAKREYNKDLAEKARHETIARKSKKILPDDPEMPTFLSSLQTVATISGVTLTSWSPGDETLAEFYAKVPMELKLEGKYHQIAKFFHGIGQVDRIINMENISLSVKDTVAKNAPDDESGTFVTVECLATAFRSLSKSEGSKKRRREGGEKEGGAEK